MAKDKRCSWRYQAVYTERTNVDEEVIKEYTICEVYLNSDDKLETWTESHKMNPFGESIDELLGDLKLMIKDVRRWKPVEFKSLKTGMLFEECGSQEGN